MLPVQIVHAERTEQANKEALKMVMASMYRSMANGDGLLWDWQAIQRFTAEAQAGKKPGPATQRLYYLTSHLNTKGTAIEKWKLPLVTTEAKKDAKKGWVISGGNIVIEVQ